MRILIFLILFSNAVWANQPYCDQLIASEYSAAILELAQGKINVEKMRVEGNSSTAVKAASRAIDKRYAELEKILGTITLENALGQALADLGSKSSTNDNTRTKSRKVRKQKENLNIWEVKRSIEQENGQIRQSFSPNGKWFVQEKRKKVEIRDIHTHELIYTVYLNDSDTTPIFSVDGETFATINSHANTITAWDYRTGEEIKSISGAAWWQWSNDRNYVRVVDNTNMHILDTRTWMPITFQEPIKSGANVINSNMLFLINENEPKNFTLETWNIKTGRKIRSVILETEDYIHLSNTFSSDKKYIFGSKRVKLLNDVIVFDSTTGKVVKKWDLGQDTFRNMEVLGERIFIRTHRGIYIWDFLVDKEPRKLDDSLWPQSLTFSPDGKLLAISYSHEEHGTPKELKLWNLNDLSLNASISNFDGEPIFSPDMKYLTQHWAQRLFTFLELEAE